MSKKLISALLLASCSLASAQGTLPTAPHFKTPSTGTNDTTVATTEFVARDFISQIAATGTGGIIAVTIGTTSAQVAAATVRTARLSVKNESALVSIACSLGGTAALNAAGSYTIEPGQLLDLSNGFYVPADALNCISSTASTPATVWSK